MRHTVRILVVTALLAVMAACDSGPTPSPAEQALERRFNVGCHQPGVEHSPYCGGGGR
jgi:hypothetical protein